MNWSILSFRHTQAREESVTHGNEFCFCFQVTNHLFQEPSLHFGKDLAAINVARAREHGVPGYANYRKLCGLPDMGSWSDMLFHMSNNTVTRYADMFRYTWVFSLTDYSNTQLIYIHANYYHSSFMLNLLYEVTSKLQFV